MIVKTTQLYHSDPNPAISQQARHYSAGFTLDRYGDLFESISVTPVEWIDDLIWPSVLGNTLATSEVLRGH